MLKAQKALVRAKQAPKSPGKRIRGALIKEVVVLGVVVAKTTTRIIK